MTGTQLKYLIFKKKFNWLRINIENAAGDEDISDAKKLAAEKKNKGILTTLKSTESNYKWVLLYNHARLVQIAPHSMWRMKRSDLKYLAGMTTPHPELILPRAKNEAKKSAQKRYEEASKLVGNAVRAQNELKTRDIYRSGLLAGLAAIVGAVITVVLSRLLKVSP